MGISGKVSCLNLSRSAVCLSVFLSIALLLPFYINVVGSSSIFVADYSKVQDAISLDNKTNLTLLESNSNDYLPVNIGKTWLYKWNNSVYHPDPIITTIYATSYLDGQYYLYENWTHNGINNRGCKILIKNTESDNWFSFSGWGDSLPQFPRPDYLLSDYFFYPRLFLKYPLYVGKTWNTSEDIREFHGDVLETGTLNATTIVESEELVTTQFGTFNALKIKTILESNDDFISGIRYVWVAENYGIVKLEYYHSDGSITAGELVRIDNTDYTISPLDLDTEPCNVEYGENISISLDYQGKGEVVIARSDTYYVYDIPEDANHIEYEFSTSILPQISWFDVRVVDENGIVIAYNHVTISYQGCSDTGSDGKLDNIIVVDQYGNCPSIQWAVDNATAGDMIIVRDGIYYENVNVNKQLTIRSENGADSTIVQAANPYGRVFEVTADYVNISGFKVSGSSFRSTGISLKGANYCNISNNNVSNRNNGIFLGNSNNNTIYSNNVSNNGNHGILLDDCSNNNTIYSNNVSNNRYDGIYLGNFNTNNNTIYSNNVSNNRYDGIYLGNFNNNTIYSNNVSNNRHDGIFLDNSNNNTIYSNNVSNNGYDGIFLDNSNNNTIYSNNFINNTENIYFFDSTNIWNSTEQVTYTYNGNQFTNHLGNYWSDYTGSDSNGDGIGDTPYSIDSDADNYPLMQSFENYVITTSTPPPSTASGIRGVIPNSKTIGVYPFPTNRSIQLNFNEWWSVQGSTNAPLVMLTGDINGDGKLEIVTGQYDTLKVYSAEGNLLWSKQVPGVVTYYGRGNLYVNLLEDVGGDGKLEIFCSRKTSTYEGIIYVYDYQGNLLQSFTRPVANDGSMGAKAVLDVDNDGDKEILAYVESAYGANPRGAVLFDYDTGQELWYYAAGCAFPLTMDDLDNDGVNEISSNWYTVNNGANGCGTGSDTCTNDHNTYILVIDENGNEELTMLTPDSSDDDGNAYTYIVDLDNNGEKELIVLHTHGTAYPGEDYIQILDKNGTVLKSYNMGLADANWHARVMVGDINNDGYDEVLVSHYDSKIMLFDHQLNLLGEISGYDWGMLNDINGDGKLEILTRNTAHTEVSILSWTGSEFTEIWSYPYSGTDYPVLLPSDLNGDGINELIVKDRYSFKVLGAAETPGGVPTPTVLILNQPPTTVNEGEEITFTGTLKTSSGVGISGATIKIFDDDGTTDELLAQGTTGNDGAFSITWTAERKDADNTIEVYAKFEGDSNYGASTSSLYTITINEEVADTEKPSISIDYPSDGDVVTSSSTITVSGTASDNVGISKVEVKVNSGSWQLASGTTSWSKTVTLSPGSNTIYARATDVSGNWNEASVTVEYNPLPTKVTLSVRVHNVYETLPPGGGSISVLLLDSADSVIDQEKIHYDGDEQYVEAQFNIEPGDYIIKVYQTPETGIGYIEFWGSMNVNVENDKEIDFKRNTLVIQDLKINGQSLYSSPVIDPPPSGEVNFEIKVKNYGDSEVNAYSWIFIDKEKPSSYDIEKKSDTVSIAPGDTATFTMTVNLENLGTTYYIVPVVYGEYDSWRATDQTDWKEFRINKLCKDIGVAFVDVELLKNEVSVENNITDLSGEVCFSRPGDSVRIDGSNYNFEDEISIPSFYIHLRGEDSKFTKVTRSSDEISQEGEIKAYVKLPIEDELFIIEVLSKEDFAPIKLKINPTVSYCIYETQDRIDSVVIYDPVEGKIQIDNMYFTDFEPFLDTPKFDNFGTEVSEGGQCAGMVITSMLFYGYKHIYQHDGKKYKLPLDLDYFRNHKPDYIIDCSKSRCGYVENGQIKRISGYDITPLDNVYLSIIIHQKYGGPIDSDSNKMLKEINFNDVLDEIGNNRPAIIEIHNRCHAILTFGYIKSGTDYYFAVYDPNYPFYYTWLKYDTISKKASYNYNPCGDKRKENIDVKFFKIHTIDYEDINDWRDDDDRKTELKNLMKNYKVYASDHELYATGSDFFGYFDQQMFYRSEYDPDTEDYSAGFMELSKDANGNINPLYVIAYPSKLGGIDVKTDYVSGIDPLTVLIFKENETEGMNIRSETNSTVTDNGQNYTINAKGWLNVEKFIVRDEGVYNTSLNFTGTNITLHVINMTFKADTDGDGNIDTTLEPPIASFTFPPTPLPGENITFNASSSYDPDGNIVSYYWNFGDGTNATGSLVNHTFTSPGIYTVTLTITDNDGINTSLSKMITVNSPPIASFTYTPSSPLTGQTIKFNASSSYDDGNITSYYWDFGDGTNATGVVVDHTYSSPGTYTVTLEVEDELGFLNSSSVNITVNKKETSGGRTSGGGGGGGGGLPPVTPLIAESEFSKTFTKLLRPNQEIVIELPSEFLEIGLSEIGAIYPSSVNTRIVVSKVSKLPADIKSPDAEVYMYFEILFTEYYTSSKLEPSGHIVFRLSKELLSNRNADKSDVNFLKWKDGKWVELESDITNEDSNFYWFRVDLDSFSLFAVTIEKGKSVIIPPSIPPSIPTRPTSTPVTTPSETPEVQTQATEKPIQTSQPSTPPIQYPSTRTIVMALVLIVAAVVIVYVLKKK